MLLGSILAHLFELIDLLLVSFFNISQHTDLGVQLFDKLGMIRTKGGVLGLIQSFKRVYRFCKHELFFSFLALESFQGSFEFSF